MLLSVLENSWSGFAKFNAVFAICCIIFSGCNKNHNSPPSKPEEGIIGPEGGVLTITDTNDPLYGVKIEIPKGALDEPTEIRLSTLSQNQVENALGVIFSDILSVMNNKRSLHQEHNAQYVQEGNGNTIEVAVSESNSSLRLIKAIQIDADQQFKKPLIISIPITNSICDNQVIVINALLNSDLDGNGHPEQFLVDVATCENDMLVTNSQPPFPGVTSPGAVLFLSSQDPITFVQGVATDDLKNALKGVLATCIEGNGLYAKTQQDGTFVLDMYSDQPQVTLIVKNLESGLFGFSEEVNALNKTISLNSKGLDYKKISAVALTRKEFSDAEIERICTNASKHLAKHPIPGFFKLIFIDLPKISSIQVYNALTNYLRNVIENGPSIPFTPSSDLLFIGMESLFIAKMEYYYNEDFHLGWQEGNPDLANIKDFFNLSDVGYGLLPSPGFSLNASVGVNALKISLMDINAYTDPEFSGIAEVVSQKAVDKEYHVSVKGLSQGETNLRGAIGRIAEISIGINYGISFTEVAEIEWGFGFADIKYLPALPYFGIEKIGPAQIGVVHGEGWTIGPYNPEFMFSVSSLIKDGDILGISLISEIGGIFPFITVTLQKASSLEVGKTYSSFDEEHALSVAGAINSDLSFASTSDPGLENENLPYGVNIRFTNFELYNGGTLSGVVSGYVYADFDNDGTWTPYVIMGPLDKITVIVY